LGREPAAALAAASSKAARMRIGCTKNVQALFIY